MKLGLLATNTLCVVSHASALYRRQSEAGLYAGDQSPGSQKEEADKKEPINIYEHEIAMKIRLYEKNPKRRSRRSDAVSVRQLV